MAELHARVRGRLRERLLQHGASPAFEDPALFEEVERLLQSATTVSNADTLLLPELLGDRETWRLETSLRYQSHRTPGIGSFFIFIKRRVLMPMMRWLFEYSRDNFERQRHVNQVLFACVQELAVENAKLRRDVQALAGGAPSSAAGPEASDRR
jgi:hypothetical protein